MEQICNWFAENNLVMYLKRLKTECVLYGTHQQISKSRAMETKVAGSNIVQTQVYIWESRLTRT